MGAMSMTEAEARTAHDLVEFWRLSGPKLWFGSSPAFDAEIAIRFGSLQRDASDGKLDGWIDSPIGALALILMLDQFSRNLHRGSPSAFANDSAAQAIAAEAIAHGHDLKLAAELQPFVYLPFEHAEDRLAQERSVDLAAGYRDRTGNSEPLQWAEHHRDIICRFGRFPHRNAILWRPTTEAERAFMDDGGFGGWQFATNAVCRPQLRRSP
jgi:uncharacterized protein (DUF924 family)